MYSVDSDRAEVAQPPRPSVDSDPAEAAQPPRPSIDTDPDCDKEANDA
jgi:hypothetical protein